MLKKQRGNCSFERCLFFLHYRDPELSGNPLPLGSCLASISPWYDKGSLTLWDEEVPGVKSVPSALTWDFHYGSIQQHVPPLAKVASHEKDLWCRMEVLGPAWQYMHQLFFPARTCLILWSARLAGSGEGGPQREKRIDRRILCSTDPWKWRMTCWRQKMALRRYQSYF